MNELNATQIGHNFPDLYLKYLCHGYDYQDFTLISIIILVKSGHSGMPILCHFHVDFYERAVNCIPGISSWQIGAFRGVKSMLIWYWINTDSMRIVKKGQWTMVQASVLVTLDCRQHLAPVTLILDSSASICPGFWAEVGPYPEMLDDLRQVHHSLLQLQIWVQ